MSFILDALRKSETDRQRQHGPGLVDAGYRPPVKRRSWWVPVLLVALVANLGVMAWMWLRPTATTTAPVAATPPAPAAPTTAAPAVPVAGRSLAAVAGVAAPEDGPYDATADLPALDAGAPVTETLPPPPDPEPESPTTAATGAVRDSLPTAEQLMANGSLQGQTLNMDLHVYSTTPAERFVFINMRRHNEGAELPEGGRIEEITPEGVVIDRNGQRFLLTRD